MTIYTNTARFDSGRAMSEDELRKAAPSIFAVTAHESRSERFQPIPTIDVLRGLMAEGLMPVGARQARTRIEGKADFTKHLIRLRRVDNAKAHSVGDTVCEILLKNANDGTSAYDLMAGLFRIRCLNSMVAQTATLDSVKVRHSGDVRAKVIEGTYRVLVEAEKTLAAPQDWSTVKLYRDERAAFAEAAHLVCFGDAEGETATPIQPAQLLIPRRYDDRVTIFGRRSTLLRKTSFAAGFPLSRETPTTAAASPRAPSMASIRISSSTKPCGCWASAWPN